MKEIKKYFIRSLMNDYIFTYLNGMIAIAICECSLISVCWQVGEGHYLLINRY